MTAYGFETLAVYNAERARGLVHIPEWDARMATLQTEFDQWVRSEFTPGPDGVIYLPPRAPSMFWDAIARVFPNAKKG